MAPTTKGADTRRDSHDMVWWIIGLAVVAGLAGVVGRNFQALEFEADAGQIALRVLGTLFIVALFVERAQQVYIYVWRRMDRRHLDKQLAGAEKALQDAEAAVAAATDPQTKQAHEDRLADLRNAEFEARITIDDFRAKTRKTALICGMALGILIALPVRDCLSRLSSRSSMSAISVLFRIRCLPQSMC